VVNLRYQGHCPDHPRGHYALDEFLGNATDLPIREHATDTHGATLINFALFDLVGKALTPRIRDLGKITMVRDDTPTATTAVYPHAGPLLDARWNEDLVAGCWPDLLRMAGSLKYGQATASLIVGKWSAASRQNTLAAALKEWGTLRCTIHSARYLADPVYRRKISRQLNKGESLHALRRDLHYAQQGIITKPHLAEQTEQAWCLTVLTNAVITWMFSRCGEPCSTCASRAGTCPMRSCRTSRPATATTSTSSAPSTSTSKPNSPSSTSAAGGPCARPGCQGWVCEAGAPEARRGLRPRAARSGAGVPVGAEPVHDHASGQGPGNEDTAAGGQDPAEARVGLKDRDEPVQAEGDDPGADPPAAGGVRGRPARSARRRRSRRWRPGPTGPGTAAPS
jgi:hypothetical protein